MKILLILSWAAIVILSGVVADEPQCSCSKFPYEEQLLEKMVRMEFAMERMKVEMNEAKQAVQNTVGEYNEIKTKQEKQLQHKRANRAPSFTARITSDIDKIASRQRIVFNDIVTNIGNSYSHTTGVFTSHENGVYFFTASVMSGSGKRMATEIVKNGDSVAKMFSYDKSHEQGTNAVILELAKSDEVWVRQLSGDMINGNYWSSFSGFHIVE